MKEKTKKRRRIRDNIIILLIVTFLLILVGQLVGTLPLAATLKVLDKSILPGIWDHPLTRTTEMYLAFTGIWILFLLHLAIYKGNRPMFKTLWTKPKGNTIGWLLIGLAIGFALNALCILTAYLNKDIFLYFDEFNLLWLIIVFVCVFIQSSAEELACRMFLYQRLRRGYKNPWVAIIGNSAFFGILHLGNDGVTLLSVLNIILFGVLASLFVYYFDSLWCAMALHAAWNFTQNIIFGLPNSGIVVPFSIFKLDASTARDSFFYNVGFGVEGTLVADIVLFVGCVVVVILGKKYGKKPIDIWN